MIEYNFYAVKNIEFKVYDFFNDIKIIYCLVFEGKLNRFVELNNIYIANAKYVLDLIWNNKLALINIL